MASRLSEGAVTEVLDSGHHGLAWQDESNGRSQRDGGVLTLPSVDLDALINAENPEAAVQAVEPAELYRAVMLRGPEDALDVLKLASAEQVTRIFDFEAWHEGHLSIAKAIRWLNLFREMGPGELYRRYRDLDEEYQVALLGPLVRVYDEEEFEKLPEQEQDRCAPLPGQQLWYRVGTDDPKLEEFAPALIDEALQGDVAYAVSLLQHACYLPPHEQEALLAQFRRARIEEDGFVTYEESLAAFRPVDVDALRRKWRFGLSRDGDAVVPRSEFNGGFLAEVVRRLAGGLTAVDADNLRIQFAHFGNTLAAAAQLEPDDLAGMRLLLARSQSLASLGLEWIADGDLAAAGAVLKGEHPRTLFQAGLALVRRVADQALARLEEARVPEAGAVRRLFLQGKLGLAQLNVDQALLGTLGFERCEVLKGALNRFPALPVVKSATEGGRSARFEGEGAKRVTFTSVGSRADLAALAAELDGIAGLVHLAKLAGADWSKQSLDRALATAVARVLGGGKFRAEPLTTTELTKVAELPEEGAEALARDFLAGVEGTLRVALAPQAGASWAVSTAAGVVLDPARPEMPALKTMDALIDVVFRVRQAGAQARAQEVSAARALSPLVDLATTAAAADEVR
jgi:hypothetical protein